MFSVLRFWVFKASVLSNVIIRHCTKLWEKKEAAQFTFTVGKSTQWVQTSSKSKNIGHMGPCILLYLNGTWHSMDFAKTNHELSTTIISSNGNKFYWVSSITCFFLVCWKIQLQTSRYIKCQWEGQVTKWQVSCFLPWHFRDIQLHFSTGAKASIQSLLRQKASCGTEGLWAICRFISH